MKTISVKQPINLKVVKFEVDFGTLLPRPESPKRERRTKVIKVPNIDHTRKQSIVPPTPAIENLTTKKKDVKELVEELLDDLYSDQRDWSTSSRLDYRHGHGSTSGASWASSQSNCGEHTDDCERIDNLGLHELLDEIAHWQRRLHETGKRLVRRVRIRDRLRRQQRRLCSAFTVVLRNISGDPNVRYGVNPGTEGPGEGGYTEWLHAMRLVARLPAGVPQHFRKKLWLSLSDRHLSARGVDWPVAERACFRGTAQPDDTELGAQILKDLHRTGCSLFCGTEGRENQAMLRRVLLAYARWNKDVGYCQGFNMLAAIILEVMDKSESDSLKVMIYLVEAVLPEGYFADDLRGLSADMAAFRDLLRLRLPRLANHMDHLQRISDGGGVEPPLPDVFTMQWFLTLYATWLQRDCLLRIWDLVMLDGNEVLLLTALAIWDMLQDRILSARSADEFYSCMGGGAGAVWEAGESLVVRVVSFGSAPELPRLRNLHRYRVAPPAPPAAPSFQPPLHNAMQTMTKRGLRLFYSEDEGDSSDDGNKMALATIIPRREDRLGTGDRLTLDIGALKRQYARLRERQRQAHVILAAACARHAAVGVSTSPTSLTVNNLLLGKSAIVSSRGRRLGPPPGAVPPSRQPSLACDKSDISSQEQSSDTISWNEEKSRKTLSRRNSVKWKDIKKPTLKLNAHKEKTRKASIDFDETGDGIIVSEREANEMIASLRPRSSSESSSYSSKSASSTDTSLCDENERDSESEAELHEENKHKHVSLGKKMSPLLIPMESQIPKSPLKEIKITHSPVESKLVKYDEGKKVETFQNITEYLDTAAGEPLRTYIDGFESKLKDSYIVDSEEKKQMPSPLQISSPISPYFYPTVNNELDKINLGSKEESTSVEVISPIKLTSLPKKFKDLSPIALSPGNFDINHKSCDYDFKSNVIRPLNYTSPIARPPDIIDAFAMNPNFVPDIDLSDKYVSDVDSPTRSPGAESIVVSEDEPPIPLKIDKYFEHSPEFFGARVTDPNNLDIPNRRATKRLLRIPKKPDSLTLQSCHVDKTTKIELERASSLPQSHSFRSEDDIKDLQIDTTIGLHSEKYTKDQICTEPLEKISPVKSVEIKSNSPKDYILRFGRKNSERALQIIQENSKILSRILTKQSAAEKSKPPEFKSIENISEENKIVSSPTIAREPLPLDSLNLKESTSDTIIGYRKLSTNNDLLPKSDFVRVRPISIDDPFSFEINDSLMTKSEGYSCKFLKSPSEGSEVKTDAYGWENKGFLVKSDYKNILDSPYDNKNKKEIKTRETELNSDINPIINPEYNKHSTSATLPSFEPKDPISFDCRMSFGENNYQFSNKYNDFVLSTARDICNKTLQEDQRPRVSDLLSKTENSQATDFAHIVTSSISFTYEPSVDDDSPMGAKSNSSDTLCQITSLDQVSTPISPKIFPNKETPTLPKDFSDKIEKVRQESEDTCSTITSLMETDTISSVSYPRSPSTGSYHPFPTRPSLRMPKELGVRLGMYPKDTINSPTK